MNSIVCSYNRYLCFTAFHCNIFASYGLWFWLSQVCRRVYTNPPTHPHTIFCCCIPGSWNYTKLLEVLLSCILGKPFFCLPRVVPPISFTGGNLHVSSCDLSLLSWVSGLRFPQPLPFIVTDCYIIEPVQVTFLLLPFIWEKLLVFSLENHMKQCVVGRVGTQQMSTKLGRRSKVSSLQPGEVFNVANV